MSSGYSVHCVLRLALRCDDAVLLDLDLVLLAHRGDKFQGGGRCLSSEALDDVCSHMSVGHLPYDAHPDILYSWVMTPLALRMLSLASSTMWSGVSLGKLIMTDLWGATAMVVAANSAVSTERVAKRILWFSADFAGNARVESLSGRSAGCGVCGVADS